MPLRLVATTRPETWRAMQTELLNHSDRLFPETGPDGNVPGYFALTALTDTDAAKLREAYGLPLKGRSDERLLTPSLIRQFANLRDAVGASRVTRYAIFKAYVEAMTNEVIASEPSNRPSVVHFLNELSLQLARIPGGEVPLSRLPSTDLNIAGRFTSAGLLTMVGPALRPEPDEAIEYLMGGVLRLSDALAEYRAGRKDPLFIGGIAMATAHLEEKNPEAARQIVRDLLASKPKGLRPDFEIAARLLMELADQDAALAEIRGLVDLWGQSNLALAASNLPAMLESLRLPLEQRVEVIMRLASNEDADDWRTKYWASDTPGRWVTAFCTLATNLARESGADIVPHLMKRMTGSGTADAVALGLTIEAASADSEAVLGAVLAHGGAAERRTFRTLCALHPRAAIRALRSRAKIGHLSVDAEAAKLWSIFELIDGRSGDVADQEVWRELAASAERLAVAVKSPAQRAEMIVCQLLSHASETHALELLAISQDLDEHLIWTAVKLLGEDCWPLLDFILCEAGRLGPHTGTLGLMPPDRLHPATEVRFLERLETQLDEIGSSLEEDASAALETLLYQYDHPDLRRLRKLALRFASSRNPNARQYMIFAGGSPAVITRFPPPPEHLALLEEIMAALVDAEDGQTLGQLVWKIGQSAGERQNAGEQLATLEKRFGADAIVRNQIDFFDAEEALFPDIPSTDPTAP
ncbi:hypothetical protein ABOZ73_15715 [Caulobacter sp. 73W]|uniref:HEAT repeat domain-containing protein n=1 Tax=Caulobacter sp. 73W TaxID=3161137 RepID=A0AB39KRC0_9CAUL